MAGGRGKARIIVFAMASEEGLTGGEERRRTSARSAPSRGMCGWIARRR